MPHVRRKNPAASLDRCDNCRFYRPISKAVGICAIMTEPEAFGNALAYSDTGTVYVVPAFHCILYKFSTTSENSKR
jgi:hypothetical protein